MSLKQQLQQEAERLLLQSQQVRHNGQYAQGQNYHDEMARAQALYQLHLKKQAEADECTD